MELWQEWLGLLLRWIHVIAAITWIGDSLLFMWIDRNLRDDPQRKEGVTGVTWMIHGGGYYTLEKRLLEPGKLPPYLRWFWLEATTTWISGFLLVIVVYYMSAGAMMVDPAVSKISTVAAVHLGIFLLPVAWLIYDGLWRTPLRHHTLIAVAISFALFMGVTWGLLHLLSPRAAYLHLGAMLASLMAFNVWVHILPPQRKMYQAAKEGREVDYGLGKHAKARSTQNTYMTFPVIFLMLSNHFPSIYGNPYNWALVGLLFIFGASLRHLMLVGYNEGKWTAAAAVISLAVSVWLTIAPAAPPTTAVTTKIKFSEVRVIVAKRCNECHSQHPTQPGFAAAGGGVMMDTPEQIKALAPRILVRAVEQKTMPLANMTDMPDKEREILGEWIRGGAPIQ